jgi:hypothetical protein|tara:strand:- start:357 stop:479 length:123 start_codon:yes stop_codon:yes gene_type:complete
MLYVHANLFMSAGAATFSEIVEMLGKPSCGYERITINVDH